MRQAIVIVAAAAVAGCAQFEVLRTDRAVPERVVETVAADAPQTWAEEDTPPAPADLSWLSAFADPDLEAVVAKALAANTDVLAAAARLDQANALAIIGGADRFPTLDAGLNATVAQSVIDAADPIDFETSSLSASLSSRWEVDVWGRVRKSARASAADAVASAADFEATKLSIASVTARSWFDVIEARDLVALAEDDLETQERSLRLSQRRFNAGVGGALDVRTSLSAVESAKSNLAARREGLDAAERRLEVLVSEYPDAEVAGAEGLPALAPLEGLGRPLDVLARRPDLAAAEARLTAAGFRADAARAALLPSLTLSGSVGTSGDALGELFDPDYLVSNAAGNVLAPLFRGGQLSAEAERQLAGARLAASNYLSAVLTAFREVEDAVGLEASLAEQETALAAALREAEAAEGLAERNYARGVGTIFDLLNAQGRRLTAQSSLIQVRAERASNRVRLHAALGGDVPPAATSADTLGDAAAVIGANRVDEPARAPKQMVAQAETAPPSPADEAGATPSPEDAMTDAGALLAQET